MKSRTDEELISAWRLPLRPNILIVDYRTDEILQDALIDNYRITNPDHTTFFFEGFNSEAVEKIFDGT